MWCESGSQEVITGEGREALDTLAQHPLATRVCLLLPAGEMVFRHFTLPKKWRRRPRHSRGWRKRR